MGLVQEVTYDNSVHTMKYVFLYIFVSASCIFVIVVLLIVFVRNYWYKNNTGRRSTVTNQTQTILSNSVQRPNIIIDQSVQQRPNNNIDHSVLSPPRMVRNNGNPYRTEIV